MPVKRQHVARVVSLAVAGLLLLVRLQLHGVLGEFHQGAHPLVVLVHIKEGEMQRLAPGGVFEQTYCLSKQTVPL